MKGIISFCNLFINLFAGLIVDLCRRKLSTLNRPDRGAAIGFSISFTLSSILFVICSITAAFQVPGLAQATVIIQAFGRGFGILWVPIYMFCFPIENFGFVFGFMTLAVMPVRSVLHQ